DKFVDYHFKVGRNLINLGVDVLYIGDDVGMQTAMLISPKLWRKFLKPRYSQLFSDWKKINKNIIFALHTDGYVEPIIPDLIEIGLDVLNPVQPGTMNDIELKNKYGKNLTFWGGINVQKTIPFGTAEDVIKEVKNRIEVFGKDGGFIISSAHNIQPSIRAIDNTFTYYWACNKYGIYK
ncbi:MAG: uroporphyrinogen decarboxylase family protein, partial [Candidatus Humimicrobiaceae bacterium]